MGTPNLSGQPLSVPEHPFHGEIFSILNDSLPREGGCFPPHSPRLECSMDLFSVQTVQEIRHLNRLPKHPFSLFSSSHFHPIPLSLIPISNPGTAIERLLLMSSSKRHQELTEHGKSQAAALESWISIFLPVVIPPLPTWNGSFQPHPHLPLHVPCRASLSIHL